MTGVVILQARTNSSRLPAKVLLPIAGMPVVVLAARRAANTGRRVIVATSREPSDDGLAAIARSAGIEVYRGSLDDVLGRFVDALSAFDDEAIVCRLTADNVFPDGSFLDALEAEFIATGAGYLCSNGVESGLPYGVSAELTRVGHLREAAANSASTSDREHVTPYVIRKFGQRVSQSYRHLNHGHYRCTIDCLDDYLTVQRVFSDVSDPAGAAMPSLVAMLDGLPFQPANERPVPRLVLGTAQLGMHYGIANINAQPDRAQSEALIKTAIGNGAAFLDTARAYGSSEAVIGDALAQGWQGRARIITKLSPDLECPADATGKMVEAAVDASVFRSCNDLRLRRIDVLLLHRAAHLKAFDGRIWQRLIDLRTIGVIGTLGVSVQSPAELETALGNRDVGHIQLPCHLLDWRWDHHVEAIAAERALRPLTVHVRSVLLQGLLVSPAASHWTKAHMAQSDVVRHWLRERALLYGRKGVADLCLAYMNALPWVDGLVVGTDSREQLFENMALMNRPPLDPWQVASIVKTRPFMSEQTLDPATWLGPGA